MISIDRAKIDSNYRDEVFFHGILQDLLYSKETTKSKLKSVISQFKSLDCDFMPAFEMYLRRKQSELPAGIYKKLSAYDNSLYDQSSENIAREKTIVKLITRLLNEINRDKIPLREGEAGRVRSFLPVDQYKRSFEAWMTTVENVIKELPKAFKSKDAKRIRELSDKLQLGSGYREDALVLRLLAQMSQMVPKSLVYRKVLEWGETPKYDLPYSRIAIDKLYYEVIVMVDDLAETLSSFVQNNEVVKDIQTYKYNLKVVSHGIFMRLIKDQYIKIDKAWKLFINGIYSQKKDRKYEPYTYKGIEVKIIPPVDKSVDDTDYAARKASLHALEIAIDILIREGFKKFFNDLTIKVYTDRAEFIREYGGSQKSVKAYAFYKWKVIYMPTIKKESDFIYYISTFIHEFGHAIHDRMSSSADSEWAELFDKVKSTYKGKLPSDYANKNDKEMFAELFSYILYPKTAHRAIPYPLLDAMRYFMETYLNTPFRESLTNKYESIKNNL